MIEWISVKDRMPEYETLVLGMGRPFKNRGVMYCFAVIDNERLKIAEDTFGMFDPDRVGVDSMNDDDDLHITHWAVIQD